ncbi:MAG: hypothetical protein IH602_02820 [Bryobacteraceae bacterium]|nr:hypothetical protein [Bryobacteraceae bacterium]
MDTLRGTAGRLMTAMEAMQSAASAGMTVDDWVVFIGPEGGYQMIAGYEGSLDALAWDRGARQAWRMTRRNGELLVEGKEGGRSCALCSPLPRPSVKLLVAQCAVYSV